jgi:hypothetical protein
MADDPNRTAYAAGTSTPVSMPQRETQSQVSITETLVIEAAAPIHDPIGTMPPLMVSPRIFERQYQKKLVETHMVTVVLHASGEKERDIRRLKRVHGLLRSNPGTDHFCLMIFENGFRHFLDFPNDTTGINPDMIERLVELVGAENVQVETVKP